MVKGQDRRRTGTGREVDTDDEETGQDENRTGREVDTDDEGTGQDENRNRQRGRYRGRRDRTGRDQEQAERWIQRAKGQDRTRTKKGREEDTDGEGTGKIIVEGRKT